MSTVIIKLILIFIIALGAVALPDVGCCDSTTIPQFHIETIPTGRVRCVLNFAAEAPNLNAREWLVIAPHPQSSPSQVIDGSTFTVSSGLAFGQVLLDQSAERRPVTESSVFTSSDDQASRLAVTVTYDVGLVSRWIEPGVSTSKVPVLSAEDRSADTLPSATTDYLSNSFQQWVAEHNLCRESGEDDLTFARRAFDEIRALYSYSFDPDQDRRASAICQTDIADCGGLSNLFVAVLRNASIPARLDAGRWVFPGTTTNGLKDVHVKSEFYVDGVGWVPVEMSGAVSDKSGDASLYFGRDTGQFLTMSVNTDYVVNADGWGTKKLLALQGICYWTSGDGSLNGSKVIDTWSVSKINVNLAAYQKGDARNFGL